MPEKSGAGKVPERLAEGSRSQRGKAGEDQAAAWLLARGLDILERNFRSRTGEIDIVARDGDSLVFVEVKSWSAFGAEDLERAIGVKKRRRIIETANYFLSINRKYNYMTQRFDVIFIRRGKITWFPRAFMETV